jgi:DNA-binding response OmpR family regulator
MLKILIVEDDPKVAFIVQKGLNEAGISTVLAESGGKALDRFAAEAFDMALLDLGLPDRDGRDVLAAMRAKQPNLPVIIVTARDEISDRISGLDAGADDYLVKPFAFSELLARIRALQRRAKPVESAEVRIGDLAVSLLDRTARRAGHLVDLTPREFDLLAYLARHAGETVSRDMLARDVWHVTSRVTSLDNVLDVHIAHLREKIDKPHPVKLIRTIRGVGFVLEAPL